MNDGLSTLEEVMARVDSASKARRLWWRIRGVFSLSTLRYQIQRPKWAWQRMRRGWSDRDAWSFDVYLAGVIAGGLQNIRNGHSHPSDMTPEEWEAYLDDISESLIRYREGKFTDQSYDEEMAMHDDATEAVHNLAYRFGDMWD